MGRLRQCTHPAIDRTVASAGADATRSVRVSRALHDLDEFANRLRQGLLDGRGYGPVFLSRAPGRLAVMGGIADYSGSLVLQWPIREATRVALQRRADPVLDILSHARGGQCRRLEGPPRIVPR